MTGVTVREVDPHDPREEPALRACWEVLEAVAAERPYDDSTPWETFRGQHRSRRTDQDVALLLATDGERPVGVGDVSLYRADNPHLAHVGVAVHPDARRRGVGTALLAELERRAAEDGRTTWSGGFPAPLDDGGPGQVFAEAHGYAVAGSDELKMVDLDEAVPGWPALDADVAAHLGGYRVESYVDTLPEAWVEDYCALLGIFLSNIPLGDLDMGDMVWTPARLAEHEERMAASGRCWFGTVALTPGGRVCGFTELAVMRGRPAVSWVGGTLVAPEHRGHRLGLGMKLASHRLLRELFPACRAVLTGNAGVNAPMNAVNAAMGYRVVERWLEVQKKVG